MHHTYFRVRSGNGTRPVADWRERRVVVHAERVQVAADALSHHSVLPQVVELHELILYTHKQKHSRFTRWDGACKTELSFPGPLSTKDKSALLTNAPPKSYRSARWKKVPLDRMEVLPTDLHATTEQTLRTSGTRESVSPTTLRQSLIKIQSRRYHSQLAKVPFFDKKKLYRIIFGEISYLVTGSQPCVKVQHGQRFRHQRQSFFNVVLAAVELQEKVTKIESISTR